uniref:Connector enhancer of kinase suppressor of Ras 1 n=1 Tax=Sphenodon punctatus TaxID=8508 RepID=A0A8D0L7R2_SPHPU
MESIAAWSPEMVVAWLRGLDKVLQQYPFENWTMTGKDLLQLSYRDLEELGVWCVGHQELILEAVEQLCVLNYELRTSNLRTLTEKLQGVAQTLQTLILSRRKVNTYDGDALERPSPDLLACIVELIAAAKGLFAWLNRYLFSYANDYSASRDIICLCADLAETIQKVSHEIKDHIYLGSSLLGKNISGICENILNCSPAALLNQNAVLERVELVPTETEDKLVGLVGWTRMNLVKKLLEVPSQVTLVLKKIPLIFSGSPSAPRSPQQQVSRTWVHWAVLIFPGAAVDCALESRDQEADSEGPYSPIAIAPPRPSTLELRPTASETSDKEVVSGSVATRLSRRRVSCQDLGRVDCDGWLLKKKEHVGFMAQKWKRCWFVLKGHTLYWYNHPNDEKAVGLINVSTYNLESKKEQKKKYVFQLTHEKYKPFVFAAETLADLSMWVSRLITSIAKYPLPQKSVLHREEDCYSETEAEDPEDDSPRHGLDQPRRRELERTQLLTSSSRGSNESLSSPGSPQRSPMPWRKEDGRASPHSPLTNPAGEELESLIKCLKQGGVSLIGKQQLLTHEQYRKSFIKRNKNPKINEKVHLIRALKKAKVAELQILDNLLNDSELTSEKFQHWKEQHQELYQEIQTWWAHRPSQRDGMEVELVSDRSPQDTALAAAAEP